MPFANLSAASIHHQLDGVGPKLMIINGTGSDLRNDPNPRSWPIAEGRTVLAFDHRGLGQSEPHDPDHQPSMADFATDALELADHVGWDEFAVLGISFGGMVAQEMAIAEGSRITRLVLACTSSGGAGGASYPLHELYDGPRDQHEATYLDISDTRCAEPGERRDRMRAAMAARPRPAEVPEGLRRQLEARRHHDTFSRLASVTSRTLVMFGRFDGVAPPANSAAIADALPDAALKGYRGGHLFLWQDRTTWTDLAAFLDG